VSGGSILVALLAAPLLAARLAAALIAAAALAVAAAVGVLAKQLVQLIPLLLSTGLHAVSVLVVLFALLLAPAAFPALLLLTARLAAAQQVAAATAAAAAVVTAGWALILEQVAKHLLVLLCTRSRQAVGGCNPADPHSARQADAR
jgi:hypothetical protein